jgi:hypothetical protein
MRYVLLLCSLWFMPFAAQAMFMMGETEQVPIARVFANLQNRLATNAASYDLHYQLARLHAMASSTNRAEIPVSKSDGHVVFGYPDADNGTPDKALFMFGTQRQVAAQTNLSNPNAKQHLTNAIAQYETAIKLMKKSTNVNEVRWLILPVQLGYAWCLDKAGRTNDALGAYRTTLAIAWEQEVTGEFKMDDWLKDVWADVKRMKNPLRSRGQDSIGPGVCFSEETIGYLLKLLDPVKDAGEISDLKEKQKKLSSMGRAVTPILVPLDNSPFAQLVNPAAGVPFDLDGSGLARRWGWITTNAAWLVYDGAKSGTITSGLQLFGNVTFWIFWRDGYQALASLDDNGDGLLNGDELEGLALWRDANQNGISEPGEVKPVPDFGIVGLDCHSEPLRPDLRWSERGVRLKDGTVRTSYDWAAPSMGQ